MPWAASTSQPRFGFVVTRSLVNMEQFEKFVFADTTIPKDNGAPTEAHDCLVANIADEDRCNIPFLTPAAPKSDHRFLP
jgi:hypothetical protein